jgi:phosphoribosylglycinamide formyltransferase-1
MYSHGTQAQGGRVRVAVCGSGRGSTARSLVEATTWTCYEIVLVLGSKPGAGIEDVAKEFGIPYEVLGDATPGEWLASFQRHSIQVVALAGWLRHVPQAVIEGVEGRMLNVHPSLLPKYGGNGMYGRRVHQAVFAAGEVESGATIHLVNAEYDEGPILGQQACTLEGCASAEDIEAVVRNVEKSLYPNELHRFCLSVQKGEHLVWPENSTKVR